MSNGILETPDGMPVTREGRDRLAERCQVASGDATWLAACAAVERFDSAVKAASDARCALDAERCGWERARSFLKDSAFILNLAAMLLLGSAPTGEERLASEMAVVGAEERLAARGLTLPLGFKSPEEFIDFTQRLAGDLERSGYADTRVAFQGSSVTGVSFETGVAFDLGRTSDFDIALAGEGIFGAARGAGIGVRQGGIRTGPLDAAELQQLGLSDLRATMTEIAGRNVEFMIYRSIEELVGSGKPSILGR
jgi:hypothetical protein